MLASMAVVLIDSLREPLPFYFDPTDLFKMFISNFTGRKQKRNEVDSVQLLTLLLYKLSIYFPPTLEHTLLAQFRSVSHPILLTSFPTTFPLRFIPFRNKDWQSLKDRDELESIISSTSSRIQLDVMTFLSEKSLYAPPLTYTSALVPTIVSVLGSQQSQNGKKKYHSLELYHFLPPSSMNQYFLICSKQIISPLPDTAGLGQFGKLIGSQINSSMNLRPLVELAYSRKIQMDQSWWNLVASGKWKKNDSTPLKALPPTSLISSASISPESSRGLVPPESDSLILTLTQLFDFLSSPVDPQNTSNPRMQRETTDFLFLLFGMFSRRLHLQRNIITKDLLHSTNFLSTAEISIVWVFLCPLAWKLLFNSKKSISSKVSYLFGFMGDLCPVETFGLVLNEEIVQNILNIDRNCDISAESTYALAFGLDSTKELNTVIQLFSFLTRPLIRSLSTFQHFIRQDDEAKRRTSPHLELMKQMLAALKAIMSIAVDLVDPSNQNLTEQCSQIVETVLDVIPLIPTPQTNTTDPTQSPHFSAYQTLLSDFTQHLQPWIIRFLNRVVPKIEELEVEAFEGTRLEYVIYHAITNFPPVNNKQALTRPQLEMKQSLLKLIKSALTRNKELADVVAEAFCSLFGLDALMDMWVVPEWKKLGWWPLFNENRTDEEIAADKEGRFRLIPATCLNQTLADEIHSDRESTILISHLQTLTMGISCSGKQVLPYFSQLVSFVLAFLHPSTPNTHIVHALAILKVCFTTILNVYSIDNRSISQTLWNNKTFLENHFLFWNIRYSPRLHKKTRRPVTVTEAPPPAGFEDRKFVTSKAYHVPSRVEIEIGAHALCVLVKEIESRLVELQCESNLFVAGGGREREKDGEDHVSDVSPSLTPATTKSLKGPARRLSLALIDTITQLVSLMRTLSPLLQTDLLAPRLSQHLESHAFSLEEEEIKEEEEKSEEEKSEDSNEENKELTPPTESLKESEDQKASEQQDAMAMLQDALDNPMPGMENLEDPSASYNTAELDETGKDYKQTKTANVVSIVGREGSSAQNADGSMVWEIYDEQGNKVEYKKEQFSVTVPSIEHILTSLFDFTKFILSNTPDETTLCNTLFVSLSHLIGKKGLHSEQIVPHAPINHFRGFPFEYNYSRPHIMSGEDSVQMDLEMYERFIYTANTHSKTALVVASMLFEILVTSCIPLDFVSTFNTLGTKAKSFVVQRCLETLSAEDFPKEQAFTRILKILRLRSFSSILNKSALILPLFSSIVPKIETFSNDVKISFSRLHQHIAEHHRIPAYIKNLTRFYQTAYPEVTAEQMVERKQMIGSVEYRKIRVPPFYRFPQEKMLFHFNSFVVNLPKVEENFMRTLQVGMQAAKDLTNKAIESHELICTLRQLLPISTLPLAFPPSLFKRIFPFVVSANHGVQHLAIQITTNVLNRFRSHFHSLHTIAFQSSLLDPINPGTEEKTIATLPANVQFSSVADYYPVPANQQQASQLIRTNQGGSYKQDLNRMHTAFNTWKDPTEIELLSIKEVGSHRVPSLDELFNKLLDVLNNRTDEQLNGKSEGRIVTPSPSPKIGSSEQTHLIRQNVRFAFLVKAAIRLQATAVKQLQALELQQGRVVIFNWREQEQLYNAQSATPFFHLPFTDDLSNLTPDFESDPFVTFTTTNTILPSFDKARAKRAQNFEAFRTVILEQFSKESFVDTFINCFHSTGGSGSRVHPVFRLLFPLFGSAFYDCIHPSLLTLISDEKINQDETAAIISEVLFTIISTADLVNYDEFNAITAKFGPVLKEVVDHGQAQKLGNVFLVISRSRIDMRYLIWIMNLFAEPILAQKKLTTEEKEKIEDVVMEEIDAEIPFIVHPSQKASNQAPKPPLSPSSSTVLSPQLERRYLQILFYLTMSCASVGVSRPFLPLLKSLHFGSRAPNAPEINMINSFMLKSLQFHRMDGKNTLLTDQTTSDSNTFFERSVPYTIDEVDQISTDCSTTFKTFQGTPTEISGDQMKPFGEAIQWAHPYSVGEVRAMIEMEGSGKIKPVTEDDILHDGKWTGKGGVVDIVDKEVHELVEWGSGELKRLTAKWKKVQKDKEEKKKVMARMKELEQQMEETGEMNLTDEEQKELEEALNDVFNLTEEDMQGMLMDEDDVEAMNDEIMMMMTGTVPHPSEAKEKKKKEGELENDGVDGEAEILDQDDDAAVEQFLRTHNALPVPADPSKTQQAVTYFRQVNRGQETGLGKHPVLRRLEWLVQSIVEWFSVSGVQSMRMPSLTSFGMTVFESMMEIARLEEGKELQDEFDTMEVMIGITEYPAMVGRATINQLLRFISQMYAPQKDSQEKTDLVLWKNGPNDWRVLNMCKLVLTSKLCTNYDLHIVTPVLDILIYSCCHPNTTIRQKNKEDIEVLFRGIIPLDLQQSFVDRIVALSKAGEDQIIAQRKERQQKRGKGEKLGRVVVGDIEGWARHGAVLALAGILAAYPFEFPAFIVAGAVRLTSMIKDGEVSHVKTVAQEALSAFWLSHRDGWKETKEALLKTKSIGEEEIEALEASFYGHNYYL